MAAPRSAAPSETAASRASVRLSDSQYAASPSRSKPREIDGGHASVSGSWIAMPGRRRRSRRPRFFRARPSRARHWHRCWRRSRRGSSPRGSAFFWIGRAHQLAGPPDALAPLSSTWIITVPRPRKLTRSLNRDAPCARRRGSCPRRATAPRQCGPRRSSAPRPRNAQQIWPIMFLATASGLTIEGRSNGDDQLFSDASLAKPRIAAAGVSSGRR